MMINAETCISLGFIIAVIGCLIGIYKFVIDRDNNNASDIKKQVKTETMLENIERCVNDIKQDMRVHNSQIQNIQEKQIIQEQEVKALWKKADEQKRLIDDIQEKVIEIEKTL